MNSISSVTFNKNSKCAGYPRNPKNKGFLLKSFLIGAKPVIILLLLWIISGSVAGKSNGTKWVEPVPGVQVHPIFHASLEVKLAGKTLLIDPSFDTQLLSSIESPDLILITDIHGDHMDPDLLERIQQKFGDKPIIAPKAVAECLPEGLRKNIVVLANGATKSWEGIRIEAVPMYNLPDAKQLFHPKGRGNGYVLRANGKSVYFSGDTQATTELRHLKNIDLAFVCMNLPYTMDVEEAAEGVLDFQPKVVIPYHYKGTGGLADLQKFKKLVAAGNKAIKVELLDFYPQ